jgi:hypothetical protein
LRSFKVNFDKEEKFAFVFKIIFLFIIKELCLILLLINNKIYISMYKNNLHFKVTSYF